MQPVESAHSMHSLQQMQALHTRRALTSMESVDVSQSIQASPQQQPLQSIQTITHNRSYNTSIKALQCTPPDHTHPIKHSHTHRISCYVVSANVCNIARTWYHLSKSTTMMRIQLVLHPCITTSRMVYDAMVYATNEFGSVTTTTLGCTARCAIASNASICDAR